MWLRGRIRRTIRTNTIVAIGCRGGATFVGRRVGGVAVLPLTTKGAREWRLEWRGTRLCHAMKAAATKK